ncbi:MAG: hypothetical protein U0787_13555 [Polyangia bacterium]
MSTLTTRLCGTHIPALSAWVPGRVASVSSLTQTPSRALGVESHS